ncbi:MAG TPA: TlpA disulfide reductase family protein [Verrucomicrobiae bacterium]|jgi:peroxiredoxin
MKKVLKVAAGVFGLLLLAAGCGVLAIVLSKFSILCGMFTRDGFEVTIDGALPIKINSRLWAMFLGLFPLVLILTGLLCGWFGFRKRRGGLRRFEAASKVLLFFCLLIVTAVLALMLYGLPWRPSGGMTAQQYAALTNAVRIVSNKPILKIRYTGSNDRAFVMTDSVTDSVDHVETFGFTFEHRLFGWVLVARQQGDPQQYLAMREGQLQARKIQAALGDGTNAPDFEARDVMGHPLSLASFKGRVVLVDFWATWCAPCRGEVPNVVATFQKYHGQGFEIIGVSLDMDRQKLLNFIKEHQMPWPECFEGNDQPWANRFAIKYGIAETGIPMNFLLDGSGKIIGKNLRGEALPQAVAKALAK